jgi:hypothetical protein
MQNGAHKNPSSISSSGRLLGFVRVLIGGQHFDLAVQAMSFEKDGTGTAGGFFESEGQLGILVDDTGSPALVQAQIERGTEDAVRHLSQKYLN